MAKYDIKAISYPPKKASSHRAYGILGFIILVSVVIGVISKGLFTSPNLALGTSSNSRIPGWNLLFSDEFMESDLNTAIWNARGLNGYKGCCLGFGSQTFVPEAASLAHGQLVITSSRDNTGSTPTYTSAVLTTENKMSFLYGRIDIRARIPKGQGMWPAFWLLTAHATAEVDMMEMVNDPTTIYQTVHMNVPTYNTKVSQCTVERPDLSRNFHVYSLVWTSSSLIWYIDGTQTCEVTQYVPQAPMYILIDNAVGGIWPGPPDASTTFPQALLIDYVRIYKP